MYFSRITAIYDLKKKIYENSQTLNEKYEEPFSNSQIYLFSTYSWIYIDTCINYETCC